MPTMTTAETVSFYARIIIPTTATFSHSARHQRVTEVVTAMGLGHVSKTPVGGTLAGGLMLRGLSGGERKRLAVAVGILAAPAVVFLDEPTSGLDSFAALSVMGHLQKMADTQGQTIISTIHQPRFGIWSMFKTMTLLANGRLMYTGPTADMVGWFGSLGFCYDPSCHGVSSDWALDLVAVGFNKPKEYFGHSIRDEEDLDRIAAAFLERYLSQGPKGRLGLQEQGPQGWKEGGGLRDEGRLLGSGNVQLICEVLEAGDSGDVEKGTRGIMGQQQREQQQQQHCKEHESSGARQAPADSASSSSSSSSYASNPKTSDDNSTSSSHTTQAYRTGWWAQCWCLLLRELLVVTRNPYDVAGRTLTFCWVGILQGLLFFNTPQEGSSFRSRMNLVFCVLVIQTLLPYASVGLYSADKKLYIGDAASKLYRPSSYYLAKVCQGKCCWPLSSFMIDVHNIR